MTRIEAKKQIEIFFSFLREKKISLSRENSVHFNLGRVCLFFDYDESGENLSVQALIHRFRQVPNENVLNFVFAEENKKNTGGGRIVFDGKKNAFFIQRNFSKKMIDVDFYQAINNVAQASLIWNRQILSEVAVMSYSANN
jgi:hypothetical protein